MVCLILVLVCLFVRLVTPSVATTSSVVERSITARTRTNFNTVVVHDVVLSFLPRSNKANNASDSHRNYILPCLVLVSVRTMSRLPSTTTVRTGTSNRISIEIFSFIYQNVKTVLIFHIRETCERSAREESKSMRTGVLFIPQIKISPQRIYNPPKNKQCLYVVHLTSQL